MAHASAETVRGANIQKLEEAVHYVCSTCVASDRLGAVKLNKILYYSDMDSFASTGQSITNATYMKQRRGPVPKEVLAAIVSLKASGRLDYENVSVFDLVRREFMAKGDTNLDVFSKGEIARLDKMIRYVCAHSAAEISEESHIVWEAADIGEELPYETFFVSHLGEVTDADVRHAQEALRRAA